MRIFLRACGIALVASLLLQVFAPAAGAYDWHRRLKRGKTGKDVKALQVRVAGWYRGERKEKFSIDGKFGRQTAKAVKRFERRFGFPNPNGKASRKTFRKLNWLQSRDGSTRHFAWGEFDQNMNQSCSSAANAYAGTFAGGMASPKRTKRYVKRLMWRLEAVRKKAGGHPMGINSGFRSVPYNNCIGGASASQHLYGTAADNRVAAISNSKARKLARRSQISGIGCYSSTTHNHFDLRLENKDYPSGQTWWWPRVDSHGRELDANGRPCWGETTTTSTTTSSTTTSTSPDVIDSVSEGIPGIGSLIPSAAEVEAFGDAGEPDDLGSAD